MTDVAKAREAVLDLMTFPPRDSHLLQVALDTLLAAARAEGREEAAKLLDDQAAVAYKAGLSGW